LGGCRIIKKELLFFRSSALILLFLSLPLRSWRRQLNNLLLQCCLLVSETIITIAVVNMTSDSGLLAVIGTKQGQMQTQLDYNITSAYAASSSTVSSFLRMVLWLPRDGS